MTNRFPNDLSRQISQRIAGRIPKPDRTPPSQNAGAEFRGRINRQIRSVQARLDAALERHRTQQEFNRDFEARIKKLEDDKVDKL